MLVLSINTLILKRIFFLTVINTCVTVLENVLDEVLNGDNDFYYKVEKILRIIQTHSRENSKLINLYNELTTEGNIKLAEKLSHQLETILLIVTEI